MKEIFSLRQPNRAVCQYKLNLDVRKIKQVTFGNKSLKRFGPKI